MSQLIVDIGGRPGLDCRGFCRYCYFRGVGEVAPLGCRYCLPFQKGCDYCARGVRDYYGGGFRPLREVADDVLARLQGMTGEISRVTISGGGDPSCYPQFRDLVELLGSMEAPLHIGYTSGKGFDDPDIARFLVDSGLSEISFTVFSVDPVLRKTWMHDPTPEASLAALERLCGEIDVYAAAVIVPGVNDGERLRDTCQWLTDRGAKGIILMRFANTAQQGLILGNGPLLPGVEVQEPAAFRDMVTSLAEEFPIRISGTPLWDPSTGAPFIILREPDLLDRLPRLTGRASVITGSVAAPYISELLMRRGGTADVVPVGKEIACLITIDDLRSIDLSCLSDVVILPGRAFVHDREAEEVLSADGRTRTVLRGPDMLTADGETAMGMNRDEVLAMEINGLGDLIRLINQSGSGS